MAFSPPDDSYVLTVSRDRTWRLFQKGENGMKLYIFVDGSDDEWVSGYAPVAADKSHGRIIWDCAWSCEGDIFATASRDKTVSTFDSWKMILFDPDRSSGKIMEAQLGLRSVGSNHNNEIRRSSNRCRILLC